MATEFDIGSKCYWKDLPNEWEVVRVDGNKRTCWIGGKGANRSYIDVHVGDLSSNPRAVTTPDVNALKAENAALRATIEGLLSTIDYALGITDEDTPLIDSELNKVLRKAYHDAKGDKS